MSEHDGRLPFDPRRVGPVDLLGAGYQRAGTFVGDNSRVLVAAAVALTLGAWYLGVSLPSVPNWLLVGVFALVGMAPLATVFGLKLADELYSPDLVLLSEQTVEDGDQRLVWVSPDQFQRLTVVNHNGEERDRTFLHEVTVNGHVGYEVDRYDGEDNVAVASWQAGVSNSEMRRERSRIRSVKTTLEQQADKALELLANHSEIVREQTRQVTDQVVRVAQDVEVPGGDDLHETLGARLEDQDLADELLDDDLAEQAADDGNADLDEDKVAAEALGLASASDKEEALDIFERAAAGQDGDATEGPADD